MPVLRLLMTSYVVRFFTLICASAIVGIAKSIKKNESIEFNDGIEDYYIFRGIFKGELWFKAKIGYAGVAKTSRGELDQLLESLLYAN